MANDSKINSGNVLKGAAAVTAVAGVVAAGVLLSDKKNRKKAGKMAAKGMEMAKDVAHEISNQASEKYQAAQMEMPMIKNRLGGKNTKDKAKKTKAST